MRESTEGVGADEEKERRVGREGWAQAIERVDSVIGSIAGGVDERELESRIAEDGETGHLGAIFEAGGVAGGFERLQAYRSEENSIQAQGLMGGPRDGQMSEVGWIEAAAEEGYPHWVMVAEAKGRPLRY